MRARTSLDADLIAGRWDAKTAGKVLGAWRASGSSLAAFGREHGIGTWRLGWWRKRIEAGAGQRAGRATPIARLPPAASRSSTGSPVPSRCITFAASTRITATSEGE